MQRKSTPRPCEVCGTIFRPQVVNAGRFCSRRCAGTGIIAPLEERFWAKVDRSGGPEACWPWTARRSRAGYGRITHRGRAWTASRVAWELTNGPIRDGRFVLHRCDNPPCCNPAHLFLGTPGDNMADMWTKGRRGVLVPPEVAAAIRARYGAWTATNGELAREYGLTPATVARLVRGIPGRPGRPPGHTRRSVPSARAI